MSPNSYSKLSLIPTAVLVIIAVVVISRRRDPMQEYRDNVNRLETQINSNLTPEGKALVQFAKDHPSGATTYDEPNGGFKYVLPDDWVLRDGPGLPYKMAFGKVSEGSPGNISVTLVDSTDSLADAVPELINGIKAEYVKVGLNDFKVVQISKFETNSNLMGIQVVTQATRMDGEIARQILYLFQRGDEKKLCVVCSAPAVGTQYDHVFDSIMKTFEITR